MKALRLRFRRPALPEAAPGLLLTTGCIETDALGTQGVFLRPGDWVFARGAVRVTTLLGSGVALALWAPRHRLGAVCHCLLPDRAPAEAAEGPNGSQDGALDGALDGRYGSDTAQWLDKRFAQARCPWAEVETSVAGGASSGRPINMGAANIAWAQAWAAARQLSLVQQDVGGRVVRRLTFNTADGALTIAHGGRMTGNLA